MAVPPPGSALVPLDRAATWLNSQPLNADALRRRVVLVNFWTYSCVNWLRTLPYLRAWAERYAEHGFVVVGVHAPEFSFEHVLDNVRRAIGQLRVEYPVVIDNEFVIWRAFDNHYWPATYLVDGEGLVRFHHFGEEAYEETERAIQQLLGIQAPATPVDPGGLAVAADWGRLKSPETYLGSARGERRSDQPADALALNQWILTGLWAVEDESAALDAAPGSIVYRFEGRDLNLVLTPADADRAVHFSVRLDGQPPGDDRGLDVDVSGAGAVGEPRMYQLIRHRGLGRRRTFEITFHDPGVHAYVFTFG